VTVLLFKADDNDLEERAADVIDAYVNSSGGESDDDDDQEDDVAAAEKKEKLEQAQANLEHLESGAAQLEPANEFKQFKESNKRKLGEAVQAGGAGAAPKSALKGSSSSSPEQGSTVKKAKHVDFDNKYLELILLLCEIKQYVENHYAYLAISFYQLMTIVIQHTTFIQSQFTLGFMRTLHTATLLHQGALIGHKFGR